MARDELVTGNVWEQYSKKVQDRMNNPVAMGEFTQEDANKANAKLIVADFGAESCGDAVRLFWLVDEKNTEVEAFLRDDADTPAVPPQKMHCSVMAYDVIIEAAAQYKGITRDDIVNADIVCECARKTRKDLVDAIRENNIKDIDTLVKTTKAGSYCKSCIKPGGHEPRDVYLVDILADTLETLENERLTTAADTTQSGTNSFDKMTIVQRIKAVDAVIDEYIRPMLVMDGGDMEIIDIKENIPHYDIYIRYLGACGSCASGSTGTLYAIESTLKQKVDENIRVMPV